MERHMLRGQDILLYTDVTAHNVVQYEHVLLRELVKQGYQLTCVQREGTEVRQQEAGVKHIWLEHDPKCEGSDTDMLTPQTIFAETSPDLIIFSDASPLSNFDAKQTAILFEIPYILLQGAISPSQALYPPSTVPKLTQIYDQAKAVLASSQEDLDCLHRLYRLPKNKGQLISLLSSEEVLGEIIEIVQRGLIPKGDYISPGLAIVQPDKAFPFIGVGNLNLSDWAYLRREIPHNWYVDVRHPLIGFLSRDEASILYNTALQFKGKRALEIGCWLGWSACHLALAGVVLDVIDPFLENPSVYESVSTSLQSAGVAERVTLHAGLSPEKVEEIAEVHNRKWPLIFIDGNHEAPGPLLDAIVCENLAEEDAIILFHDLASPDVAQGLNYLQARGWNTMVYQTMQIMGVAWRGNVQPVEHHPDPEISWKTPPFLRNYPLSAQNTKPVVREEKDELPLVSICIPLYNKRDYIERTLKSALSQTYPNIEIIISDNASNDGSEEIAFNAALKDKRIKYFRLRQTIGIHEHWLYCLSLASGDYVKLLCADDQLHPDYVHHMAEPMLKNPELGFTVCRTRPTFTLSSELKIDKSAIEKYFHDVATVIQELTAMDDRTERAKHLVLRCATTNNLGDMSGILIRRSSLPKPGSWPPHLRNYYFPDWDYQLRLYLECQGCFIDRELAYFDFNPTGGYFNLGDAGFGFGTFLQPLTILADSDLLLLRESCDENMIAQLHETTYHLMHRFLTQAQTQDYKRLLERDYPLALTLLQGKHELCYAKLINEYHGKLDQLVRFFTLVIKVDSKVDSLLQTVQLLVNNFEFESAWKLLQGVYIAIPSLRENQSFVDALISFSDFVEEDSDIAEFLAKL
jgi:glycosyltransferase involved in cell wall biosynthesis/predicted O-methyltransferase YrrM